MKLDQWMTLQNGSDIRGVAMGEHALLTKEAAGCLGRAFGMRLRSSTGKLRPAVAVGYDSRLTGPALAQAFGDGLAAEGCRVLVTGLSSTPSMFMTCTDPAQPADGAVMVTASHLPKERNGFKFFTAEGGLSKETVSELLRQAAICEPPAGEGAHEVSPFMAQYAGFLRDKICGWTGLQRPLEGLRILVDAGGGAGGFYAIQVLQRLGADVEGSLYLEPDGSFSGHVPNPEKEEALRELSARVVELGADLGVAFDPDVDRAALIDSGGALINRNRFIALTAAVLAPDHPGSIVVTDSVTSSGLTAFLEGLGLRHHRFKRGYKNVIDEAARLCRLGQSAPLAIETSGHVALQENFFLDDGAYVVTRLIAALVNQRRRGGELADLIAGFEEPLEEQELRFTITAPDFKAEGGRILEALQQLAETQEGLQLERENFEGVRINVPAHRGWFLLRLSLHDPVLAANLESDAEGGLEEIRGVLLDFLRLHRRVLDWPYL